MTKDSAPNNSKH